MKESMDNLQEQRDLENKRAVNAETRSKELFKALNDLQEKKKVLLDRNNKIENDNRLLIEELKKYQTAINEIKDGKASLNAKIESLEADKVSLVLDQINHMREIDNYKIKIGTLENSIESLSIKLEQEYRNSQSLISSKATLETELQRLKEDKEDFIEVYYIRLSHIYG